MVYTFEKVVYRHKYFGEYMYIKRDVYLNSLIGKMNNGLVKVITGVRRSGKSFILFNIFYDYLKEQGIDDEHIIKLALDTEQNAIYRNPIKLGEYLSSKIIDGDRYYILLDEVQFVIPVLNPAFKNSGLSRSDIPKVTLFDVLNGMMNKNADIYITGSNSKMLSKDLVTEFRGRDDQVLVMPLSFKEYYGYVGGDKDDALDEYIVFGGMPRTLGLASRKDKMDYLERLFSETYIKDIASRYKIDREDVLSDIINILCSSVGSLTSINKLRNTLNSIKKCNITHERVQKYIDYIVDSMLFGRAVQYSIKGKRYIDSTIKYYAVDTGLRNARLNFRLIEETHLMENIIYNELIHRGYSVDVGIVELYGKENTKTVRNTYEIDFIAYDGNEKVYIQSTFALTTDEKRKQESRPLLNTGDGFRKIIIERNCIASGLYDEDGIKHISLADFLLNEEF